MNVEEDEVDEEKSIGLTVELSVDSFESIKRTDGSTSIMKNNGVCACGNVDGLLNGMLGLNDCDGIELS